MGISVSAIKYVQSLRIKKFRQKYHHFVVEGDKAVHELLQSSWVCISCYHTETFDRPKSEVPFYLVSPKEMERLSHHQSPQNALAVVEIPRWDAEPPRSGIHLYLDGIRDPGNLGTILRIADWYGLDRVYCSEDTVDLYNPKSIDASMGSFLRVKLIPIAAQSFFSACTLPTYASVMEGNNIHQTKAPKDAVIIIGNEGKGIQP
ncbi:MAG: RNA methyltransferase, partial [Bacteroidota bacterium]|nr:RNA methyltransferase [Bacteroidota bacterium]MDX5430322.1 RNA methyltransferase [Bacteroidota bacterium]MDX5469083.1 RNA methyltransferase [Bacteroidota bacterium]